MEIIVIKIILLAFWTFSAISFFVNYQRIFYDYTYGIGRLLFYLLIIVVSPIIGLNNVVIRFIGLFMPEGWEIGDDEFYKDQEEDDDGHSV